MENNQQLTELLALDLGINLINRRPYAKEVFKWQDIDLLPHSSADTLLCEIYKENSSISSSHLICCSRFERFVSCKTPMILSSTDNFLKTEASCAK